MTLDSSSTDIAALLNAAPGWVGALAGVTGAALALRERRLRRLRDRQEAERAWDLAVEPGGGAVRTLRLSRRNDDGARYRLLSIAVARPCSWRIALPIQGEFTVEQPPESAFVKRLALKRDVVGHSFSELRFLLLTRGLVSGREQRVVLRLKLEDISATRPRVKQRVVSEPMPEAEPAKEAT